MLKYAEKWENPYSHPLPKHNHGSHAPSIEDGHVIVYFNTNEIILELLFTDFFFST